MVKHSLLPVIQSITPEISQTKYLIIIDRDGTLNQDFGYTYKISDLLILNKNVELINKFIKVDSSLICVTNQSGIGRGYFSLSEAKLFNKVLGEKLKTYNIRIDAFFMCPHLPITNCPCRKPKTLMLEMAKKYSGTSKSNTIMIGDSKSDQAAASNFGIKFIKVPRNDT
jgi:D-glycero-D-manno-heptose 1,7-bisphosphate phosphatase